MHRDDPHRSGHSFQLGPSLANVSAHVERRQRWVRLARATVAIAIILAVGTYGYWYLGDERHSVIEALYMTVISISTVGFTEVIPITTDVMRIFTMSLILLGGASVVYFLAAVAAFIIEGDVLYGFWRRRLEARLRRVRGHVIVAGLGRVGAHAFSQLFPSRVVAVGIDLQAERVESLIAKHGERVVFAVGEAFDERTLRAVGVERAHALIACLPDDRDNFLLGVTARQIAPEFRLLFRVIEPDNAQMFADMGPEAVVHPPVITGRRVANTLLRGDMLAFTDVLLAADTRRKVLVEVVVDARLARKSVGALRLRRGRPEVARRPLWRSLRSALRRGEPRDSAARVAVQPDVADVADLIVGHRRARELRFWFHPPADLVLEIGDVLLVLTDRRRAAHVMARLKWSRGSAPRKNAGLVPVRRRREPVPRLRDLASSRGRSDPTQAHGPASAGTGDSHAEAEPWQGHVVVAGAGAIGRGIVDALLSAGERICVIEREAARLVHWTEPHPRLRFVAGDVFLRDTLCEASIASARAFVSALQSLRDNLFLSALVRHHNEKCLIVGRVGNEVEARRLRSVGALTLNPGEVGGVHLARLAIHPEMVSFAEGLEASLERNEQLSILALPQRSRLVGSTLAAAQLQTRTGCVIVGLRPGRTGPFRYHPPPEARLGRSAELIALGDADELERLSSLISLSS